MATKIYKKGNFLIAEDIVTRDQFFRINPNDLGFIRDRFDNFRFVNKAPVVNGYDAQALNVVGNIPSADIATITTPAIRYIYPASEIADSAGIIIGQPGSQWADADEFDDWLSSELGGCCDSGGGGLTSVATDATLTGDGTPGDPLSVASTPDQYEERWDLLNSLIGGAWHTIGTTANPDRVISVVFDSNVNNNSCGARAVGSSLNRRLVIDKDSTVFFNVMTDATGQIQVYTTNTNVQIRIEGYHK